MSRALLFAAGLLSALLGAPAPAAADPLPLASFPAGGGQRGLSIARDGEQLTASACLGARCDWVNAAPVALPPEAAAKVEKNHFSRIDLGERRSVVRLSIPVDGRVWEALIVAPLSPSMTPEVVFSDFVGLLPDDEGELSGRWIDVYPKQAGSSDVVIGEVNHDVTLCGRRTLLNPKLLYAKDLKLHRVKLQRLGEEERAGAVELKPVSESEARGVNVSRAVVASSAKGTPAALSDGDRETLWAENRGGDGSGEFVVLATPRELAINSVHFVYPTTSADSLSAPTAFWIATDASLYRVEVDDPSPFGKAFRVELPAPEQTSCVALVLDQAAQASGDVDVALAEFWASANIDKGAIEALLAELDDPASDGASASATLTALGKEGVTALRRRYPKFTATGKARALSIYDSLDCSLTASAYAKAVSADNSAEDRHALSQLERCGTKGVEAAARALARADAERLALLAPFLSRVAPLALLERAVPLFEKRGSATRRALRRAIYSALTSAAAIDGAATSLEVNPRRKEMLEAIRVQLANDELSKLGAIELLRSMGAEVSEVRDVAVARVAALSLQKPEFRERYLLLEPLAQLAAQDPNLERSLKVALADENAPVRARAAQLAPASAELLPALLQAADDAEVRVRQAAIENLGEHRAEVAKPVLMRRLQSDPWPLVRAAAVKALTDLAPSSAVDSALEASVNNDASPHVRRPALFALGARNARGALESIRDRLEDEEEDPYVRAAAAATLGTLCDVESVELLSEYAEPLDRLTADEATQVVGRASLAALGRLAPRDLAERLSIYDDDRTPPWVKQAADAAKHHADQCPR